MDKWKVTSFVSLIAILSVSAVVGWQFLNKPAETPETPGEPPQDTENTTQIEKPEFHIYGVHSKFASDRIAFNMQNLGNVSATLISINFSIKIAPNPNIMTWYSADGTVDFIWVVNNTNIEVIKSKETNEYYISDIESYIWDWDSPEVTVIGRKYTADDAILILESHWNVTCAEDVTETFDF